MKSRYGLPDRFVVTLSGWTEGARKKIDVIVESFRRHHGRTDRKLVVVGKDCDTFEVPLGNPGDGWGADVLFPEYIEQEDLPAI